MSNFFNKFYKKKIIFKEFIMGARAIREKILKYM